VVHGQGRLRMQAWDCLRSSLRDLLRIFHSPSGEAPGYCQSPLRSSLRSFAEKADYVILIQENT
jgi:hypothetical protein